MTLERRNLMLVAAPWSVAALAIVVLAFFLYQRSLSKALAPSATNVRRNVLVESMSRADIVATAGTYFSLDRFGEEVFVRSGTICTLRDGELGLRTLNGEFAFSPKMFVSPDANFIEVEDDGRVFIKEEGQDTLSEIGQIECNRFGAGRILEPSLLTVFESQTAPSKESFGAGHGAFVLVGWRGAILDTEYSVLGLKTVDTIHSEMMPAIKQYNPVEKGKAGENDVEAER